MTGSIKNHPAIDIIGLYHEYRSISIVVIQGGCVESPFVVQF